MTKYREILRLKSLGFSERNIAQSCGVSRNTVAKVLKKAAEINLSWPLDFDMTDSALEELMFPKDKSAANKRISKFRCKLHSYRNIRQVLDHILRCHSNMPG